MFDFLFKKRQALPLPYKREIHCHIIPGVDDGSPELEFSIEYLRRLQSYGLERIIFTPHYTYPNFMNYPETIEPVYRKLVAAMRKEGLTLEPEGFSFEYRMDETFLEMLNQGKFGTPECRIKPLHERSILVECAWQQPIAGLDQLIYRLQNEGYYPILAHPERYMYWASRNWSRYEHLQDIGLEFQCNILSFAGYYGETIKKTALWMLKQGYVNFMGSDLHNRHHADLIGKFLASKEYAALRQDMVDSISNERV